MSPLPALALAHDPAHGFSGPWWSWWNLDPLILASLLLAALAYGRGLRELWSRGGRGSGISVRRAGAFWAGLAVLAAALLSPIDALSDALGWMHMVQHMLLLNLAAPLLVLGSPFLAVLWAVPARWRRIPARWWRGIGRLAPRRYVLAQGAALWSLYALVLWIWHVPALYGAALSNELLHDFQHLTFLASACLFWRVLLDPLARLRLGRAVGVLYLFATSLHATLLGVFMALSPVVWYEHYELTSAAFDLTALEDQQIAGLIMWMPACMVYALLAALLFGLWMREQESAG